MKKIITVELEGTEEYINQTASDILKLANKEDKEKYYNGKVICTKSESELFTKGKIYEFENGKTITDRGNTTFTAFHKYKDFEDFQKKFDNEFLEIVEEPINKDLYNGKVVCVACSTGCFKVGKIYQFVNGKVEYEGYRGKTNIYKSFEEFQEHMISRFIEVKEW